MEIYQKHCNDCNGNNYGQSRRAVKIHHSEHLDDIKQVRSEKSNMAHYAWYSGHSVDQSSLKLAGHVIDKRLVVAYESQEVT